MKKGNITGGLILVLVGAWFLAVQFVPQLNDWAEGSWPLTIIGVGVVFLLVSILNNIPGLSIPAFIIGGIGSLLYYQNVTGDWDSWAYAWSFIPGFVGLGLLFYSLQAKEKGTMQAGFILLFLSTMFFVVFGSFLGAPVVAGLWSMVRSLLGKKKEKIADFAEPVEPVIIEEEAE